MLIPGGDASIDILEQYVLMKNNLVHHLIFPMMKLIIHNMKPYKIINDSMLNMLSHIEENSIDCVITDPPYHLTSITKRFGKEDSKEAQFGKDGSFKRLSKGFMGKELGWWRYLI